MRARLASFDELVTLVETLPHRDLARALAGQMVTMGALNEWDSETIEHVAAYAVEAVKPLEVPDFVGSCDDEDALKWWCSVDPCTSYREWAARYDFVDPFTVVGAWHDSEPLAFGAIEGRHQVGGDLEHHGYQPWATVVEAVDAESAMDRAIDEMADGRSDDDD